METQIRGGLGLIFLDQVSRFGIGACFGGVAEVALRYSTPEFASSALCSLTFLFFSLSPIIYTKKNSDVVI
jgi:hypothetical protein